MRRSSHSQSPHHHPRQTPRSGAFHRQSHDTFVLTDWLDATRKAGTLGPTTLERKSHVQDVCANELFTQVRIGSPKIAAMLERVWEDRTELLKETISKLRHQISVRDYAQTELFKVAKSAGLHAERTKRLGNQWEVQRGAVMEELRDTKSELHSIVVERNQLRKETKQLRGIIQEYVLGVGLKTMKKKEATRKKKRKENEHSKPNNLEQDTGRIVADERDQAERDRMKTEIIEDLDERQKQRSSIGNVVHRAGDGYESEEEDLQEFSIRERVKSIKEADHQLDTLLLDLMGEKRAQKAAIRGTQRLVKQFISTVEHSQTFAN
jgi:hypothetical protein